MKKMLFLIGVGAALAYFFDPDSGGRRRADAKAKVGSSGPST